MQTFTQKSNAVRAARKAIAGGTAPAPDFEAAQVDKGADKGLWFVRWIGNAEAQADAILAGDPVPPTEEVAPAEATVEAAPAAERKTRRRLPPSDPGRGEKAAGQRAAKRATRETKADAVVNFLRRREGATSQEVKDFTGWKIVSGFLSRLKSKGGFNLTTEKVPGRAGVVYRIVD
jgi:hypothetical protein